MGGSETMVKPESALAGRNEAMRIEPTHYVLKNPMKGPWPEGFKVAVFANGCFWGSEKGIWRLPGGGIYSTAVGYAAGFTPNPTYEEACSGRTGHTEAVQVVYDPSKIAFADILRWFWEAHDPTAGMGQGNDRGTQYRSGFYWFDDEQKELILASKAAYEQALGRKITTECAAAADYDKYGGVFYYGEHYHRTPAPAPAQTAPHIDSHVVPRLALHVQSNTLQSRVPGRTAPPNRSRCRSHPSSRGRRTLSRRSTRPSCRRRSGTSTVRHRTVSSARPTSRSRGTFRRDRALRAAGMLCEQTSIGAPAVHT